MLEALLRNWRLKLLSLLLAFVLWVAVTGESPIVQDFEIPLALSVRDEHTISGRAPRSVTVRLQGPESLVRGIEASRLEVVAELKDLSPGQRTIQLSPANVKGVPAGVRVERIDPDRLSLTLARKVRRTVPVIPSFLGKPPEGYAFYGAEVSPDTVDIEGPEPEVSGTSRVRTDPIHLEHAQGPFTARVGAVPDSPEVRVVDQPTVAVRVQVDLAPIEIAFPSVPVVLAGQTHEAEVRPATVRVRLAGPPSLVSSLRAEQVRVVADLAGLPPGPPTHRVPLRLELVGVPATDLARIAVKEIGSGRVEVRILDRRIGQ